MWRTDTQTDRHRIMTYATLVHHIAWQKRFSRDHCCWGRSKSGCRIEGSHTKLELTTSLTNHNSSSSLERCYFPLCSARQRSLAILGRRRGALDWACRSNVASHCTLPSCNAMLLLFPLTTMKYWICCNKNNNFTCQSAEYKNEEKTHVVK